MSEIVLSQSVRSNLLNLQSTAELLGKTQERLATGLKVNSALDNPINFFTASSLKARSSDLGRLLDSVSNAVQTIQAADNGLTAITKLVESAQATARQALQTTATLTANTPATITGNIDFSNDTAATTTGTLALGNDVSATATGTTAVIAGDATSTIAADTETLSISVGNKTLAITFNNAGGAGNAGAGTAAIDIDIGQTTTDTVAEVTAYIQTQLQALGGDAAAATVGIVAGKIAITSGVTTNKAVTIVDGTAGSTTGFGLTDGTYEDTNVAISALAGQALSVTVGSSTTNVTFGLATAGVSNKTELTNLLGSTATIAGGFLKILAANNTDDITVSGAGGTSLGIASASASSAAVAALAGTIDVSINGGTATTVDIGSLSSAQDLADAFTAAGLTAAVDATTGFLSFTANNGNDAFSLTNTASGDVQDLGSNLVSGASTDPILGEPNPKRDELRVQFNDLRTQIDQLAADSGFNGVNLLNGDNLTVLFNEDGTSSLSITGVTFTATGLSVSEVAADGFNTNTGINTSLDQLKAAADTLRAQSAAFGSNLSVVQTRQDFTKNTINTLETGAANLTLADTNEEAANLLALQTRQQLSTTALSLASQAAQAVLRLF